MESQTNAQRSLWLPISLSVVVHLVLLVTLFQLKFFGQVFSGDSEKRLPELEKLAEAQEQRINEFLNDTAEIEIPAIRTSFGGSPVSGLENSEYTTGPDIKIPTVNMSKTDLLTSPTGEEAAIEAAEHEASRPLLPPSDPTSKPHSKVSKDRLGIPLHLLRPKFKPEEFAEINVSFSPANPGLQMGPLQLPSTGVPTLDLPVLPMLKDAIRSYPLDDDLDVKLEVYRDDLENADYFRLTLKVRPESTLTAFSKDNLFLVDVSGSVSKEELRANFDTLLKVLRNLPRGDTYNVVLFHLRQESIFREFRQFSEEDVSFLEDSFQRPERAVLTDLSNAVKRSLEKFPGTPGRPMNVYLLTDGKATVGKSSLRGVTSKYSNAQQPHHNIFAFNSGRPANLHLLNMVAFLGRGFLEDCEQQANAPARLMELIRVSSRPVMTDVAAQYMAPAVSDLFPEDLPNLYRDKPLVICGKCTEGRDFVVRLAGNAIGGKRDIVIRTALPAPDDSLREIAVQWARGRIYQLLKEYFGREDENILQAIRTLSVRYSIDLPFELDR